ncbi:MAG: glycosyltransferase [Bacteroidales bacterium]|nr:glycosyltransferase [Bacteroidales bacterium]
MRLSIILPVYNVSKWLGRCIASIRNQGLTADDYEIVAVNDGSTDDSMEVLAAFRAEEEKSGEPIAPWVIINQENKGLSAARNTGLKAAHGTYVWFVDTDDYLVPGCLKGLLEKAESLRLDALCFGLQLVHENGDIQPYPIADRSEGRVLKGEEFMLKVDMPPAAWAALYRRGYLQSNNLKFAVGLLHEDQEFTPRAYFKARRIAFDPTVAYNYMQRDGSIMKSANPKKSYDMLEICQRLWDFAMENTQIESSIRYLFINRISFLFSQALSNFCRCGIDQFPGDEKKLPYYPLSINKYLSKKERYKYQLINIGVHLYLSLYSKFVKTDTSAVPGSKLRSRP